jgi:hypothetical protein
MLSIRPEYLRLRAARLRRSAMNLEPDPDAKKVWQMADDMDTLALEIEERGTRTPRTSAPAPAAG